MTRIAQIALAVGVMFVLTPSTTFAHGEGTRSVPAAGADLRNAPEEVRVALTERPARDARIQILDGCGEEVSQSPSVVEDEIVAPVVDGAPGRWTVTWAAISSLDGHNTRGSFAFRVVGEADCPAGADASEAAAPVVTAPAETAQEPRSSFPLVAVSAGVLGLVAMAAAIRFTGAP